MLPYLFLLILMKQFIAAALSAAAIVPLIWYTVVPQAKTYCPTDASGNLLPYSIVRMNNFGEKVELLFGKASTDARHNAQTKLCTMVADYPA